MRLRGGLIGEEIDGEVVMIDLGSGIYYSLRGGAVVAWKQLGAATTRDGIIGALQAEYDADRDVLAGAVDTLLADLRRDGLIVEDDEPEAQSPSPLPAARRPYEPIAFERFDDMAHIIQLDPVHDIDPGRGWPRQGD